MYSIVRKNLCSALAEGYHVVLFPNVKNLSETQQKLMAFGVKKEVAQKTLQRMLSAPPECITFYPDVAVTVVYPYLWDKEPYVKKFVGEVVALSESAQKRKILVDGTNHPLLATAAVWDKQTKNTEWFFNE